MVDARHSVVTGKRREDHEEPNVLDLALDAKDDEILSRRKSSELSKVEITVGGTQLGSALGAMFSNHGEEVDEEDEEEAEPQKKAPPQLLRSLSEAKRHEEERKVMRERKRKELEQKFLKERFAERKKLNAAKRSMDPRAYEEVRKKIHKLQTDRLIDDSDGKFELSEQELDAAIEDDQRLKQKQTNAMKRQMGHLMGMTQKLMAGVPPAKKQQMSQMMNKLGMGKFDKLVQRMMNGAGKKQTNKEEETHTKADNEEEDEFDKRMQRMMNGAGKKQTNKEEENPTKADKEEKDEDDDEQKKKKKKKQQKKLKAEKKRLKRQRQKEKRQAKQNVAL